MDAEPIKLILTTPEFFQTPFKKLVVETNPVANRTYFLDKRGQILAVGAPSQEASS